VSLTKSSNSGGRSRRVLSAITPAHVGEDAANVMRQALAGMLWSKQYFFFDVDKWLEEHDADPLLGEKRQVGNRDWFHMISDHVISMPDKWEYPWFAAWDLAFDTIALSSVAIDFAKEQLDLLLRQPICIRPDRSRPMSGTSAMSTHRSKPGRRSLSIGWRRHYAAKPISIF
jgi:hypothetical protein